MPLNPVKENITPVNSRWVHRIIFSYIFLYLEWFDQYISSREGVIDFNIYVLGVILFINGHFFNCKHHWQVVNILIMNYKEKLGFLRQTIRKIKVALFFIDPSCGGGGSHSCWNK